MGVLFVNEATVYLKFDEVSGNPVDSSSSPKTVVQSNTTAVPTGRFGGARQKGGGTGYLYVDNVVPAGDFTIAGFLKYVSGSFSSNQYNNQLLGTTAKSGYGIAIGVDPNGKYSINGIIGGSHAFYPTTIPFNDGVWRHVALVKSGTTYKLFIDGVLQLTRMISDAYGTTLTTDYWNGGGAPNFTNSFYSQLDEVVLIPRALSDAEVSSFYSSYFYTYKHLIRDNGVYKTIVGGEVVNIGSVVTESLFNTYGLDTLTTLTSTYNKYTRPLSDRGALGSGKLLTVTIDRADVQRLEVR